MFNDFIHYQWCLLSEVWMNTRRFVYIYTLQTAYVYVYICFDVMRVSAMLQMFSKDTCLQCMLAWHSNKTCCCWLVNTAHLLSVSHMFILWHTYINYVYCSNAITCHRQLALLQWEELQFVCMCVIVNTLSYICS